MKTAVEVLDSYIDIIDCNNIGSLIKAMEEYADQFKPKWIDVKEQMPESFTSVLLFCDYIGTNHMCEIDTIGCWQKDHWTTDRDNWFDKEEIIVRKWMPIPQ